MGARSEQGSDLRPRRNCQARKNTSLLCSALRATRDTGLWAMWSRAHTSAAGPAQPETVKTLGFTNSQEEHLVFLPKGESLDGLHTQLPRSRGRRAVGLWGCRSSLPRGQCMWDAIYWASGESEALEDSWLSV